MKSSRRTANPSVSYNLIAFVLVAATCRKARSSRPHDTGDQRPHEAAAQPLAPMVRSRAHGTDLHPAAWAACAPPPSRRARRRGGFPSMFPFRWSAAGTDPASCGRMRSSISGTSAAPRRTARASGAPVNMRRRGQLHDVEPVGDGPGRGHRPGMVDVRGRAVTHEAGGVGPVPLGRVGREAEEGRHVRPVAQDASAPLGEFRLRRAGQGRVHRVVQDVLDVGLELVHHGVSSKPGRGALPASPRA